MAEAWVAAAITVGGGLISGYASGKKKDKENKREEEMTREGYLSEMGMTEHQAALDDYYKQKGRLATKRGLDEFRKFSTVHSFAPQYENENTGPVLPELQSRESYLPEKEVAAPKKKRSTLSKMLDPAGIFA